MTDESPEPVDGRPISFVAAVGVATGAITAVIAAAAWLWSSARDEPAAYGPRVEAAFVEACRAAADEEAIGDPAAYCSCAFERLRADVAFERFVEIDRELAAGTPAVPQEVTDAQRGCVNGVRPAPG